MHPLSIILPLPSFTVGGVQSDVHYTLMNSFLIWWLQKATGCSKMHLSHWNICMKTPVPFWGIFMCKILLNYDLFCVKYIDVSGCNVCKGQHLNAHRKSNVFASSLTCKQSNAIGGHVHVFHVVQLCVLLTLAALLYCLGATQSMCCINKNSNNKGKKSDFWSGHPFNKKWPFPWNCPLHFVWT